MNKEIFVNYESDISKAGGFSALPPMHQQAYEIIKEASSDFSDWDQLIAVAEEPDIEKLIQIHLEWLKTTLTQKHVDSHVIIAKPAVLPENKDRVNPSKKGTTSTQKTTNKKAEKPIKKVIRNNWWKTKGTVRERIEQIVELLVDVRIDADGEFEEQIASVENELREALSNSDEKMFAVVIEIYAGWEDLIAFDSVPEVQSNLRKVGEELNRIISKMPKPKKPVKKREKKPMPKVSGGELKFGDDVKYIRAFLAYLKGDQGRTRMVNLYKRMAKANAEKRFTDSQYKTALNSIVTTLYEGITTEKSRISYPEPGKQRLEEIRDKNSLSYSVQVMKRFFNMIGEKPSRDQIEKLLHMAEKVGDTDQNYTHIKRIKYHLSEALQNDRKEITIDQPSIQGLAGVLKDCGCKLSRGKWEGIKGKKV